MSLRNGDVAILLRDHPVTFSGDSPEPFDHGGKRYVFSRILEGGYGSHAAVYVFRAT